MIFPGILLFQRGIQRLISVAWCSQFVCVGCPVVLPRETECVLLGAAIIGAVAAKNFASITSAMKALNAPGLVRKQALKCQI